jgi:hypothetical protein
LGKQKDNVSQGKKFGGKGKKILFFGVQKLMGENPATPQAANLQCEVEEHSHYKGVKGPQGKVRRKLMCNSSEGDDNM